MSDAQINPESVSGHALRWLPAPNQNITVAVYRIADETGAFKPSEGGQTLSRAVTQAPTPILIKALHDAGNRTWFDVIERENLGNLIKERQIIQEMRARYLGETELNQAALPALKFAGVLIEGAITGYDTNTRTGGAGARYLGIGGSTQYREDSVSVYLRVVSVKTGEVLTSITAQQRVASVALQGDAFRFVSFQKLLEAEAGITLNQPRHMAVRQALEKAVYGLIVEGAELGLWGFENQSAGAAAIEHYRENFAPRALAQMDGGLPPEFYAAHMERDERTRTQLAAVNTARQHQRQRPHTPARPHISAANASMPVEQPPAEIFEEASAQGKGAQRTAPDIETPTPSTNTTIDQRLTELANQFREEFSTRDHASARLDENYDGAAYSADHIVPIGTTKDKTKSGDVLASAGVSIGEITSGGESAAANLVLLNSVGGM